MKKSPKLYLLVGLALLIAGLLAVYLTGVLAAPSENQVKRHLKTDPSIKSISTAVRASNVVTITTSASHGFAIEQTVVIAGVGVGSFNGTFTITSTPTLTTFTYGQVGSDVSSSGGTATAWQAGTSRIDQWTCTTCHQRNWSLLKDAHKTHASGIMLAFYDKDASNYDGCGKCHTSTSVRSAFGQVEGATQITNAIRKQVDPQFCLTCHGKWTASSPSHTANMPTTEPTGCMRSGCHDAGAPGDPPQTAHANKTWINQIYGNARAYCLKCHGDAAKYMLEETNP